MEFASSPVFFEGKWMQGKDLSAASLYRLWALNDGAFETLHFDGQQILWTSQHQARLQTSLKALHLDFPEDLRSIFQTNWARTHLPELPYTLRITCWREGEGTYPSSSRTCKWMLFLRPSVNPKFEHLFHCHQLHPIMVQAPNYEWTGKFPSQYYSKPAFGWPAHEEALLVSEAGHILETPSANIFIQTRTGQWITPELSSGCLSGITRRQLIGLFLKMGQPIEETSVSMSDLHEAQACWLSNTSYGIRPLKNWQGRTLNDGPQESFRNLLYKDGIEAKTM